MGLREDREAKKQEKIEKQQEKRKPKLTYVHGIDGRRYINDKILRNLEGSQGGTSYSTYSSVNNYEANGFLSYEDLMEETEKLTLEATEPENSFDEFAPPSQQDGFSISHANAADVANADLEAAFDKAARLGRTVHATLQDLSLGAFQAHAFNNAPPQSHSHGFNVETQSAPDVHAEKVTGDINTTIYDGCQDGQNAYQQPANPQQQPHVFGQQQPVSDQGYQSGNQQPVPNHGSPLGQAVTDQNFGSGSQQAVQNQDYSPDSSAYAAPGNVGKPKQISGQQSNYGMLADDFEEPAYDPRSKQPQPSQRPPDLSVSQQMRALPPPVRFEQGERPAAPVQGKEEYNKLLGGLFKDSELETPAQAAPLQPPAAAPSFNQMIKQVQANSSAPPEQQVHREQVQQPVQYEQIRQVHEPVQHPLNEQVQHHLNEQVSFQPVINEVLEQQPAHAQFQEPEAALELNSARPKDSLLDFPTTAETSKPTPKINRKKPPLPRQKADEVYFEDNATSGKTSIFKMPTEGVVRSSRGTVELLVHKGGRMFRPHYNPVGILLRVDVSDGFALIKGEADKAPWHMADREGNPLDEDVIHTVAFDKKGNLWYETVAGKKTKFLVDGGVEVTNPGGDKKKL